MEGEGKMQDTVSFDDWESGGVKLTDELFEPVYGAITGYTWEHGTPVEHRNIIGYRGRETGTRVGMWFAEVMEPV